MEPLIFPTGQEVYDALMNSIEPELLSANLDHLDDAYASETEDARRARYERYAAAFAQYDEAFASWTEELNETVRTYRKTAFRSAEAESRTQEEETLSVLEQDIATIQTPSPAA